MNIDNIFKVFAADDDSIFRGEENAAELLDNDFIKVGTLIKGMENYILLDRIYSLKFGTSYESKRESIKRKYYLGLVQNLPRPGELHSNTLEDLVDEFGKETLSISLSSLIDYFVEIEDFDPCITLKAYLDAFGLEKLDFSK